MAAGYIRNADGTLGDKVYPLDEPYDYTEKIPGGSVTFIINWVNKAVQDVTVTFDANGGEGTMAAQTLTEGKGTLTAQRLYERGLPFRGLGAFSPRAKRSMTMVRQSN